jgi:hypothetical protein
MSIGPSSRFPVVCARLWFGAICVAAVTSGLVAADAQAPGAAPSETSGQRTQRLAGWLEDRQDRQTRAGLIDEAAQTSRQLDDLVRAQRKKCADFWKGRGQPRNPAEARRRSVRLSDECRWLPGTFSAGSATTVPRDPAFLEMFLTRAPLFAEPVIVAAMDGVSGTTAGVASELVGALSGAMSQVNAVTGDLATFRSAYLIETFTFNYLGTGRDLVREVPKSPTVARSPVVFADPVFGPMEMSGGDASQRSAPARSRRSVGARFEPLPGTAAEARAIKQVVPDATIYQGDRATETMLKAVAGPRILHLATHGFFLEDQVPAQAAPAMSDDDPMLRSGLVLASVNERRSGVDDGVLTALEAAGLDLAGTQLVVLSACETGVGDVKTGEGVFGLRRAFTAAGAETLVISLWQVDDAATEQFMVEFYRRLTRGEARGEALRQSALTLLRDPARRHPFYWASFIATGETGPLHR